MASQSLISTVDSYENYIEKNGKDEQVINAYVDACSVAINGEKDIEYGLQLTKRAKELIEDFCTAKTGGTIWDLEKYAFDHKTTYELINKKYEVLLLEAQNKIVDSYFQYIEKKREPKDRFYMPRRKQLIKIGLVDALQGMIDDKYDILCVSLVPGAGKSTIEKFFHSAVAGWFPKDYSLFYSHSGDITRMYYDGVYDIVTNDDDYAWHDIFPNLSVTSTNAKMEQFNIGKYKPFPSVQCTSVGSKNAGKVRASKFLLVDDMIGGIEEALNPTILDKLWDKYAVDARQRKTQDTDGKPCKEIHIATRWSVHDVIGRIQNMYIGNPRVKTISVPDVDPVTGESNFDYEYGGFTKEFFADQQLLMDEISYRCLYKQEPIEREGLLFPDDKIRRYFNLPHGEPEIITAQCDTKGKGTDYFVMPILQKYGEDYYCVDCVCDNTADYEMQYENASNTLVNNQVQECEFERNAGGDRVAMEVNKRVENKGWICNITDVPTETNKEARIFQCSNWILQHIIFKDQSLYKPNEPYGVMVSLLKRYSVTGKKQLDDVPDVFSNFALRMTQGSRIAKVEAVHNPFRGGLY
nr:MAG TPA: Terminase [Bacteriophage sp.]